MQSTSEKPAVVDEVILFTSMSEKIGVEQANKDNI
jgi:hypothetical protein